MNRTLQWLSAAMLTVAGGTSMAATLPGPVVTPEWLDAHRAEVAILDVREDASGFTAAPEFSTDAKTGKRTLVEPGGHIAGALMVEFAKLRAEREIGGRKIAGMLPDVAQFQHVLRAAGVPSGKPIVIVTQGTTPEDLDTAARTYWSLKVYGSDRLAILDGGMSRWLNEGRAVETSESAAAAGDWTAGELRAALVADSEHVAGAAAKGVQLVDARPLSFFYGLQKRSTVAAAGHIAGARPYPGDLRTKPVAGAQQFMSAAEYRSLFAAMGLKADSPLITYCNTGHMASGAWFIASEIVGNKSAALYDGSMLEWAAEGRPVMTLP